MESGENEKERKVTEGVVQEIKRGNTMTQRKGGGMWSVGKGEGAKRRTDWVKVREQTRWPSLHLSSFICCSWTLLRYGPCCPACPPTPTHTFSYLFKSFFPALFLLLSFSSLAFFLLHLPLSLHSFLLFHLSSFSPLSLIPCHSYWSFCPTSTFMLPAFQNLPLILCVCLCDEEREVACQEC